MLRVLLGKERFRDTKGLIKLAKQRYNTDMRIGIDLRMAGLEYGIGRYSL